MNKKKLRKELERWKDCTLLCNDKREKYIKALRFYAKKDNWISKSEGFLMQYDPEPSAIKKDKGQRARKVLSE